MAPPRRRGQQKGCQPCTTNTSSKPGTTTRLRAAAQHRAAQARAAHRHDTQPALLPRLTRAWRQPRPPLKRGPAASYAESNVHQGDPREPHSPHPPPGQHPRRPGRSAARPCSIASSIRPSLAAPGPRRARPGSRPDSRHRHRRHRRLADRSHRGRGRRLGRRHRSAARPGTHREEDDSADHLIHDPPSARPRGRRSRRAAQLAFTSRKVPATPT